MSIKRNIDTSEDGDVHKVEEVERPLVSRHPFQHKWTLWFLKPPERGQAWENSLKEVVTIECIEDFWAVYLQTIPPSALYQGCDYYLFKEGIKPMWEDPSNINGGRWVITLGPHDNNNTELDELWLELLMIMTGEQFEHYGEYVCGAAINIRRRGDKLTLWTTDASAENENTRIGRIFQNKLGFRDEVVSFELHQTKTKRIARQYTNRPKTPDNVKYFSSGSAFAGMNKSRGFGAADTPVDTKPPASPTSTSVTPPAVINPSILSKLTFGLGNISLSNEPSKSNAGTR